MSFFRTGLRELGLKIRRQRTRMALRHEKRLLQKSEINLGREGTSQAANFPELRNEIVALKKLEQEQKEVALRIGQIEEAIKKIEEERQANTRAQNEATGKLEAEKKPILQRRNDVKLQADLCDRELASVDRRIESNDSADRELLKELSALQAMQPPPSDLQAKSVALSSQRSRLPAERAELVRARLGGAEACRLAKEKLVSAEAELAAIEKNIEGVRSEFEAKDRTVNENLRTQQEAIREARAHHQVVEERKNPAYLNIGRHLATQGIAPPNAPQLLTDVQRHRSAVDRHLQHTEELAVLSSQIDKQELRKFYFSVFSILVLSPLLLFLVIQPTAQREWLPQETESVMSLNIDRFEKDDLPKRWRKEQPDAWNAVWNGLIASAAKTPVLNLARDASRIIRAMTIDQPGRLQEFLLIEARSDVTAVVRAVSQDKSFEHRTVGGLPVWQRPDLAVARLGPRTLAVGASSEVDELAQVRLGMQPDLKTRGQFFERFQALDRDSAVRLISRDPSDLPHIFHPIFQRELLDVSQLLGLSLTLQNPVRARLLIKLATPDRATQVAREMQRDPARWLRLQDSDLVLYAQPPEISRDNANLEVRFSLPENAARLLFQRLAKSDIPTTVAQQVSAQ